MLETTATYRKKDVFCFLKLCVLRACQLSEKPPVQQSTPKKTFLNSPNGPFQRLSHRLNNMDMWSVYPCGI